MPTLHSLSSSGLWSLCARRLLLLNAVLLVEARELGKEHLCEHLASAGTAAAAAATATATAPSAMHTTAR